MTAGLDQVFAAIDAANAKDPGRDPETREPAALLYGHRMSGRLAQLLPGAEDALAIAVRGQHIERWTIPRSAYPLDRVGYLLWRNELKDHHARRLAEIMAAAGYDANAIDRVKGIVRKERLKADPQAQALEDVACLVFLEFYAADFAGKHEEAKVIDIVRKTWRKMSPQGHAAAAQLALDAEVARIVSRALAV